MRLQFLGFILLLVLCGCPHDSGTNSPPPQGQVFTLKISGTFNTGQQLLSVDQVAILLDNRVVQTTNCSSAVCTTLTITGTANSVGRGTHTVDLQLLRHSVNAQPTNAAAPYTIFGDVTVADSTGKTVQDIPLNQVIGPLAPGQSAEYTINVNP